MNRPTGSSVLIPGLEGDFSEEMIHELKKVKGNPDWLAQYHGGPQVHNAYVKRGQFYNQNKSFLLENLTKEDSGVYEQWLNQEVLFRVILNVTDPVEKSDLTRTEDNNGSCHIYLQCSGLGGDPLNVTYLKDGVEINRNISRKSKVGGLVLNGADPQDWGNYTCNLTNLVSWKMSQHLVVQPAAIEEEFVPFCISCFGISICCIHILCHCFQCIKKFNDCALNYVLGVLLELAALAIFIYYGYYFQDLWTKLIVAITISVSIVLTRICWLCYLEFPETLQAIMKHVLFFADFVFIPVNLILEIILYNIGNDLCGIKMWWRWTLYFCLPITMATVACVLEASILGKHYFCRKPDSTTPPQEQLKLSPLLSTETAQNNSGSNEAQAKWNTPRIRPRIRLGDFRKPRRVES
ncbi:uncharacterized protein LOC142099085 isoform X2 [Mixophyes fleayi]|uniref:uncharacterized protein LOC142099085 isoform X2 n=1 Tax=Mixophyes fleayi TaxID=3061075 RepID=UPI003F4D870B